MESQESKIRLGLEDLLLLAAILLLPWAFGGVEIWAYRIAAFLLVSGAGVAFWKRGLAGWGLGDGKALWLLPAFLLALWAVVQVVPLPPGVVRALSPEADRIYATAIPGYTGQGADPVAALESVALELVPETEIYPPPEGYDPVLTIDPPQCLERGWRSLSLQPSATQERLFWYLALLLGFLTVWERVRVKQVYRVYRGALFVTASLLALFALVQDQTWNGKIYWFRRPRSNPEAFGPYVNPAHFVGVMELCLPWLVGYAWALFRRLGRDAYRDFRFAATVLGAAVCLVASIAAASKAGAALILVSLSLLGLIGANRWHTRLIVMGLGLVLVAGAVALRTETKLHERVESYLTRAEGDKLLEGRTAAWAATAQIIRDYPITGTGFGTHREVATRYAPSGSPRRMARTHNDYLEVVSEGGWVAAALIGWLMFGFCIRAASRLRRHNGFLSVSRLGLALGLTSLALHAIVDFNHQIPANALYFVTLAALLVTHPVISSRGGERVVSRQRVVALLPVLALAGFYAYRAVIGIAAGLAWDDGIHQMLSRDYVDAVPAFEKAAVGFNRFDMQRRTGDARIDIWERQARRGGPGGAESELLRKTALDYMNALCTAPAARNPWLGLALVYHKLEWMGRERRSEAGFEAGVEPWSRVGRSGRVSIGMGRRAVEASPNWFLYHDWLAAAYWTNGLEPEFRDSVRRSAQSLPIFFRHEFAGDADFPEWATELFFETSREAVGATPLLPRASHLVDLGKQARVRGAHEDAVEVLTQAIAETRAALILAEARFHLGLSLVALGRDADGREQLTLAAEHPVFHEPALQNLAWAAEQVEDFAGALVYLRELRREQPRNLDYCLRSARLARSIQDWPVALEALQWARIVEPSDPRPYIDLIETYLQMGDLTSARAVFRDVNDWAGEDVSEELRARLTED